VNTILRSGSAAPLSSACFDQIISARTRRRLFKALRRGRGRRKDRDMHLRRDCVLWRVTRRRLRFRVCVCLRRRELRVARRDPSGRQLLTYHVWRAGCSHSCHRELLIAQAHSVPGGGWGLRCYLPELRLAHHGHGVRRLLAWLVIVYVDTQNWQRPTRATQAG
jgi:hypothetical protein